MWQAETCEWKFYIFVGTWHMAVVLNHSILRHAEYVRQIYNIIYIYMKNPQFNSLVWDVLMLASITIDAFIVHKYDDSHLVLGVKTRGM